MKYFLAILAGLLVLGCAGSQNKSNSSNSANSKNAVYDEEFDLLIAPEYDYESDVPYAEQIKITTKTTEGTTTKTAKPSKKPTATQVK
jgi:hypothetical protein